MYSDYRITLLFKLIFCLDRYPIGQDRVIFMFKDGSQAWEAKDFLIEQERMELVTIENKEYYGKFSSKVKAFLSVSM